jgi:polyphosphate kinase
LLILVCVLNDRIYNFKINMILTANNVYQIEQNRIDADNKTFSVISPAPTGRQLINRELSLIEFFRRVLDEGLDKSQPLLERLKFLSIFSTNLDEFFMIRVSSLKEKAIDEDKTSVDGMTIAGQLAEIKSRLTAMIDTQMICLHEEILPQLARRGMTVTSFQTLSNVEREALNEYFKHNIYPILTPQAVDPSHPFPYISGGSLNLAVLVRPQLNRRTEKTLQQPDEKFFIRIKIPAITPRLIPVDENSTKFVLIEDLLAANIKSIIPEATPEICHFFRITRDGDIELREEEAADLLQSMEQNLKQRRFGEVVRLEVSNEMPLEMIDYLINSLEISNDDIYYIDGAINVGDFMSLYKLERPDLKDEPLRVTKPDIINGKETIFEAIKRRDILLHHPYMPYSIVTDFIKAAVEDPDVLAIKMCLYRTGANSPIPPLLIEASERGKQVTVLIELKARFDEENNIEWAKRLEQAGVHVVYGLLGLKTHCKTTLIVRREAEGNELSSYTHLATGNYNPETSAFYTDLGLLTNDKEIAADATELFNYLTAYSQNGQYRKLLVAPINLRERMVKLIQRETFNARHGKPARIVAKMNRLADQEIINALYEASEAGVKIDLIVRGICMLRPNVEGLSENITVRSIVGRLLEHSRIYSFANDGDEEIYIGSSDWMPRNLDRRIEVLAPIRDSHIKHLLKDEILAAYLRDNVKAKLLRPDGRYEKIFPALTEERFDSQLSFQNNSNVIKFGLKN